MNFIVTGKHGTRLVLREGDGIEMEKGEVVGIETSGVYMLYIQLKPS